MTNVQFFSTHKPKLKSGLYEIDVKQETNITRSKASSNTFSCSKTFEVAGDRFSLQPNSIQSIFPPQGNWGNYFHVLPHIILSRSTLPWERSIDDNHDNTPWLALLLFYEHEKPEVETVTVKDLFSGQYHHHYQNTPSTQDENASTNVNIIQLDNAHLKNLLPNSQELSLMAHVRERDDGHNFSVLIANRLPQKGQNCFMHLVSLEDCYSEDGTFKPTDENKKTTLVSLKTWHFSCLDEKYSFKGLLEGLNRTPNALRLPKTQNETFEPYLKAGCVPLAHKFRQGQEVLSWYHGPLITMMSPSSIFKFENQYHDHSKTVSELSTARVSDEILLFNPENGFFDTSYAAAWQLGRLMALQSKAFSLSLSHWKRRRAQYFRTLEQIKLLDKVEQVDTYSSPKTLDEPDTSVFPELVHDWFNDISLLKGIPYHYLISDEKLLPNESIRFFHLDQTWMASLFDGAFSVGRTTGYDYTYDKSFIDANPHKEFSISGFLLRSEVVSGWPDLNIEAFEDSQHTKKALTILRQDHLDETTLLCIFDGEARVVDIFQAAESTHFGFDSDKNGELCQIMRHPEKGVEKSKDDTDWVIDVNSMKNESVIDINNKVNLVKLTQLIQEKLANIPSLDSKLYSPLTSEKLALQLMEGGEKIRFIHKREQNVNE